MDAVIFDCDGVLIDSETIVTRVALECLAAVGLVYDKPVYSERYLGTTTGDFLSLLNTEHQDHFGRPLPDDFSRVLSLRIESETEARLTAIDGIHSVVAALGVPKAVASGSSTRWLGKALRQVGLFDAFAPHIYSAKDQARGKPAPDVFLHAAKQLGVAGERCIAVEDSVKGTLAARAAGMRVVGFIGGGHCTPGHGARLSAAGADVVIEQMDSLLAALGRMS